MNKFKKNNKRNTMLIISAIVMLGLVFSTTLIKSHAHFKTTKSFNIIQGKIPNKNSTDILLAVKVDGKKQDIFPEKGDYIVWSDCTNEMSVDWDYDNWKAKINSDITKPFACNLNFKSYDKFVDNITYNGELVNTYPEKGNLSVSVSCNNIEGSWDKENWKPVLTGADKDTVCDVKFEDIKELLVTREILDQGEFKNVTPEYITDGVNGTAGFTITGKPESDLYISGCGYYQWSTRLRWDYELNFDEVNYIKFCAKKNEDHGSVKVYISDGLKMAANCPNINEEDKTILYPLNSNLNSSIDASGAFELHYSILDTAWHEYILDVSDIADTHIISFVGGYLDRTGSINSSTSYSNIRFTKE